MLEMCRVSSSRLAEFSLDFNIVHYTRDRETKVETPAGARARRSVSCRTRFCPRSLDDSGAFPRRTGVRHADVSPIVQRVREMCSCVHRALRSWSLIVLVANGCVSVRCGSRCRCRGAAAASARPAHCALISPCCRGCGRCSPNCCCMRIKRMRMMA